MERAGIKAGDAILAVNDRYIFTIAELNEVISHLSPGTKVIVRYRRYTSILDVSVVAGAIQ
jgi:S1-C subfamily serine protease